MKDKIKGDPELIEIYNPEGLVRVEIYNEDGTHFMDILWDDREEHTPANKEAFSNWVRQVVKRYQ